MPCILLQNADYQIFHINVWFDENDTKSKETQIKDQKRKKIEKLNDKLANESENSDQSEVDDEEIEKKNQNDFFIRTKSKKKVKFSDKNGSESSGSPLISDEDRSPLGSDDEEMIANEKGEQESDLESQSENSELENELFESDSEIIESENESIDSEKEPILESDEEDTKPKNQREKNDKELKEDIYGRLVDKKGNVVQTQKYVPPAQRLKTLMEQSNNENSVQLQRLQKQINGLFNRLSTSNIVSILNQIVQMVYSNQYTRYDIMETIYNLIDSSVIKPNCVTPHRLIVEHAALISALTTSVGVELGANMLQRLCQKLNKNLSDSTFFNVENKTFDNLVLFLSNLYHFKLFSSNLLIDLLSENLIELIGMNDKMEKIIDLILLILRSVGFCLRKDAPVQLKDLIIKLQSKINSIKSNQSNEEINNRLKFMIESINAIKNNDIRRLDTFDQQPIELIKRQMKNSFKEDQILLNISYKDLVNVEQTGRWWIVGSAWSNRELSNEKTSKKEEEKSTQQNVFSEKILKLAKEQRMNTDIRKAIFCIIVSAEDYTDAFMKLVKLSLKKQQEREIIYVIVHCALNEKKTNPYYSFLMQKFCEYDRRFRMTLQFHTWDKFKMLTGLKKQQISNFAAMYSHLIGTGAMSLSVLKNVEFGEMNKSLLQFLSQLFTTLLTKQSNDRIQEIFMKIASIKKLYQLRNAIKLFINHFMLTDKGKEIEVDDKFLKFSRNNQLNPFNSSVINTKIYKRMYANIPIFRFPLFYVTFEKINN
ncbi:nucleolar MIF4G domain-containing 1 [Brachionus plicatilis]|uniref:Nucleolar MIF4G domain-containing 1 n=1 Tax=Brachionus plicatilis TaxID=10195 RepID=A0A3M7PXX7_BRAPC|nr:nucleolar MIF4G domain-containing 1 [Brachionus plicatilis]